MMAEGMIGFNLPAAVGLYCSPNFSEFGTHLPMRPRQTHRIPPIYQGLNSITKCHLRLLRLFRSYFRLAAAIAIAGQLV